MLLSFYKNRTHIAILCLSSSGVTVEHYLNVLVRLDLLACGVVTVGLGVRVDDDDLSIAFAFEE